MIAKHTWKKNGKCRYKCADCGKERVQHTWVEEFDDGIPIARYLRCSGCDKLKDNQEGPNRPFTPDTAKLIADMLVRFGERQDVCSYIEGHDGKRVWFDYPDKIPWALARVYNRSEEQMEYLLKTANLL